MTIATLTMNPALDIATATPELRPSDKLRCDEPRYDPGGGGINVARMIHELGGSACAVFPAGGPLAKMLELLLDRQGVAYCAVPIAGETRESFTVHEESTDREYRFVLPGPTLSDAEQAAVLDALGRLNPRPAWLVVSGSLPPGVPHDFYGATAKLAAELGARLVLDCPGAELATVRGAYLVKPNLAELEELAGCRLGRGSEAEDAARRLIADGVAEVVLVSLGANGALVVTADTAERVAALSVRSRSTVGAGDSMLAATVFALSAGKPLSDAVRLGMAAGAAATLRPGTQLARREDVERLYAELRTQEREPRSAPSS